MMYKVPVEVNDAINGYARVTRSIGVLVKLLDAANDDAMEIAARDLSDLLGMLHENMERQDKLLTKLTGGNDN